MAVRVSSFHSSTDDGVIDKDEIQAAGECCEDVLAANPKQAGEIEEVFSIIFQEKSRI